MLSSLYADPAIKFWAATFGLSLFLFLSGFCLYRSSKINNLSEVHPFYKKRVLRIYPLYLIIVAVYVLLQYSQLGPYFIFVPLTPIEIVANAIGLQALLNIASYDALWFIGLILTYYVIYPFMMLATGGKTIRILLFSCAVLVVFAALRVGFDLVNLRLIYYFIIFVGGVLASKAVLSVDLSHLHLHTKKALAAVTLGTIPLVGVSMILYQQLLGETGELASLYADLINYVPKALISFLFIACALSAAKLVTLSLSRRAYSGLLIISSLSYAIYLIHPLILTACTNVNLIFPDVSSVQIDAILVFIGIPAIIAASYALEFVQKKVTTAARVSNPLYQHTEESV